jgi:hypothetical protein
LLQEHPDYAIVTSFPDLADSTGAPVLAEIIAWTHPDVVNPALLDFLKK